MYKLLLISKYLRRKLAPLFAAVAVTICTAMVIIVASVMGGFLGLMQTTAKQLTPDVVIQSPSLTGFEDYEALVALLEAEPAVGEVTPAIVTPAAATIAEFNVPITSQIMVQGIDPSAYHAIVPFHDTLLWSADDVIKQAKLDPAEAQRIRERVDLQAAGRALRLPPSMRGPDNAPAAGAVIGVEVNPIQMRRKDGSYGFDRALIGGTITLGMPVFSVNGEPYDFSQPRIQVVNEFKSGFFEADSTVIFVPFDWLQQQLQMQRTVAYTDFDEVTGLGGDEVVVPARCTHIYVKAADGVSDAQLHARASAIVRGFQNDRPGVLLDVLTWEDVHGTLLNAVKNEKGMVTFLFAIISLVAIIMVATTFYMIVLEKTRDIGVLRAIGAPASGVLGLFLTYGLAIGLIGAGLGVWLAWFTVTNLNNLQEALANRLGTLIGAVGLAAALALGVAIAAGVVFKRRDFSLGSGVLVCLGVFTLLMTLAYYGFPQITLPVASGFDDQIGWRMWDPQLYFFEKIPDQVNWTEVLFIWLGAVVSSVVGAIIPAVIAARLNPVEALRYE